MPTEERKPGDWYYNKLKSLLKLEDKINFTRVDFSKPWYFVLFQEKWIVVLTVLSEIIQAAFSALIPITLSYIVVRNDVILLSYFAIIYIILEMINRFVSFFFSISFSKIQGTLLNSVSDFFLKVDPIFHSTKSSGTIISKSQVFGKELSFLINGILFSLLPIFTGYFATAIALIRFNFNIGLIAVVFFVLITVFSSISKYLSSKIFVDRWIKIRDKTFATKAENLSQNQLIRSTFATDKRSYQYSKELNSAFSVRGLMTTNNGFIIFITRLLYILSILFIGNSILELTKAGTLDIITGSAILIAYTNTSYQVLKIGDFVSDITESIINVNDLWKFIREFGKQTYPVLEGDKILQLKK